MRDTLTIGRIAGIRVGVNWTWVVVFSLIVWTWATGVFPSTNPGHSDGAYVAMALVGAFLFFFSLLLHELGHALQARREGMEIEGITLWLFGGVAKFKGMFPGAGPEFRIAIAGPLVSLLLGLLFVGGAQLGLPEAADAVSAWLGYVNLTLLVFNLLPALPLDGGRVLRAALWYFRRDFAWATRVSVAIAQGFGYLLIAAGVASLILLSAFSGIWLAVLGWFLLQAAAAESRYLLTRQALGGLRVRDAMVHDPVTTHPDVTLGRFMDDVVLSRRFTTYPVTDDGRVVGLLPFRCVAEVPRSEWETRTVRDCMIPLDEIPVVREDDDLVDAAGELAESEANRALVLDGARLAGLLTVTDIARVLQMRGLSRRRLTRGR